MKIAIMGAGFAGLALSWHLSSFPSCSVDLFDSKGIGGGASGVSTGLLHPYPGEQGRRTYLAEEALAATTHLLLAAEKALKEPVATYGGIYACKDETFKKNIAFGDVELMDDGKFLITSGITVHPEKYLEGLWQDAMKKGVTLHKQKINELEDLKAYDQIVVAAGHLSTVFFPEILANFQKLKGQVLTALRPANLPEVKKSTIGKGYIALSLKKDIYNVGATYEREYLSEDPDLEFARQDLFPKVAKMYPEVDSLDVISCRAGVRFVRRRHYYPLLAQVKKGIWLFTGLGSRGLLYHGLLSKILSEAIIQDKPELLPREFSIFPFAK